jgi:hypothetical protein
MGKIALRRVMARALAGQFPSGWMGAIAIIILVGCDDPPPTSELGWRSEVRNGILHIVNHGEPTSMLRMSDEVLVAIVPDEFSDDPQLHRVESATRLPTGQIAVANSGTGQILIYSMEGRLDRRIGRRGRGPGEFAGRLRLWQDEDAFLIVEDRGPWGWQLTTLDERGGVHETSRLSLQFIVAAGEWSEPITSPGGDVFRLGGRLPTSEVIGRETVRLPMNLFRYSYHVEGADTLGEYPAQERLAVDIGSRQGFGGGVVQGPRVIAPLFAAASVVAGGGQPWRAVAGDQDESAFDLYDATGSHLMRVSWEAQPRQVGARDVQLERARLLRGSVPDKDALQREVEARPSRAATPVFRNVAVDRIGRQWIERYPLPSDEYALWWVFSSEGILTNVAELNPNHWVLEIGEDYIIYRVEDDLGRQSIEMRGLRAQERLE